MEIKKNNTVGFSMFARLIIALAVFALLSCSRQNGQAAKTTGAELRYGFPTEPATLDPLDPANTADGRSILFNVFEGLVKPDTTGRLLPCAAESWTIEQGGLVYNFTLRNGVLFHDGSPLTSADVKFTLETAGEAGFPGFTQIEKIETNGARNLRVMLKNPDPEFLPYLTIGIVKAGNTERGTIVCGTGPFYVESYSVQQNLILRRFDNYWRRNMPEMDAFQNDQEKSQGVPLEKVTIVFLADSNSLILGLLGGSIDGASLTGSLAQQLNPEQFDIVPGWSATVQVLALNNAQPKLNDVRVRQAINYGIDTQEIIDTAFFGRGEPSRSPIIPGLSMYYEESLKDAYPPDPVRARELLAEAGFGGTGDTQLSLEITVPSNYTMHVDTAQVIASQLEKIGVSAAIKQVDWASWLSGVYRERRYEATIISLDAVTISPRSFLSRYRSNSSSNFMNFNSADFDSVYDRTLVETDEETRIALYKEAQKIISDLAAGVYIQDIVGFKAFRAGTFGGVLNYPLYVIDFDSMYKTGT
ncbi:MAG TPA: ABC transporter substrate-binding protein [Treponema sp.]|nr:ABC transporter substrate-binding protein [Treponema sp.]